MTNSEQGTQTETRRAFQWNRPTIIALLYLGTILSGVSALIGLVLAYLWQNEPTEPWEDSQYRYLIRTFWIAVGICTVCLILGVIAMAILQMHILVSILFIGGVVMPILSVWMGVRVIKAMVKAQRCEGLANDTSWLW